ncbi:MAG: helix-turn-helix transcriptional regulator [Chlorobi bacterium]|nr:helix-turn-helix transcriptional regulator [Chlorobiota bacterium]
MDNDTLYIKNMVCPRCIQSVQRIITEAELDLVHIELGKVVVYNKVSREQLSEIDKQLKDSGFELLQDKTQKTIEEIKTEIINMIHYEKKIDGHVNISNHLSKKTGCDYSYLSNLFSSVEGITIEKYLIRQKIERAKELLVYDELSLKEISWDLGYSSVQHLSTQFRKITGLSPSQFKKLRSIERKPLDQV